MLYELRKMIFSKSKTWIVYTTNISKIDLFKYLQMFWNRFFFKVGLPSDGSRLGLKNKLKSPASIIFLLESNKSHLVTDWAHK